MRGWLIAVFFALVFINACSSIPSTKENASGESRPYYNWRFPKLVQTEGDAPVSPEEQAIVYYSLGQAYALDNEVEKAIEAYKIALVYDPNSSVIHARLAAELVKRGSMSDAKEHCESAIKLDPKYVDSYLLLAGIQVVSKEYKPALKTYETVLKMHPNHQETMLYYGTTLAEAGKYTAAKKVLLELIKLPEDEESGVDRAIAYYYLAKVEQENKERKQPI